MGRKGFTWGWLGYGKLAARPPPHLNLRSAVVLVSLAAALHYYKCLGVLLLLATLLLAAQPAASL